MLPRFNATFLFIVAYLLLTASAGATPVYVGYFRVSDGPDWHEDPPVYSAREAAALVFGGHYTDYAISTHYAKINNQAWADGWGDTQYLFDSVHEDFKLGETYMGNPGEGSAYSAFVNDHHRLATKRYNFVWRIAEANPVVPEPTTLLMVGIGSMGALHLRRRRGAVPPQR